MHAVRDAGVERANNESQDECHYKDTTTFTDAPPSRLKRTIKLTVTDAPSIVKLNLTVHLLEALEVALGVFGDCEGEEGRPVPTTTTTTTTETREGELSTKTALFFGNKKGHTTAGETFKNSLFDDILRVVQHARGL